MSQNTLPKDLNDQLAGLEYGHPGIRITDQQLSEIPIDGIDRNDYKARAHWVAKCAPIPCTAMSHPVVSEWVIKPAPAGSKPARPGP
ncbi:MAG: hypothetical protein AB7K04_15725 [Pseudorhodoplanes sp.]